MKKFLVVLIIAVIVFLAYQSLKPKPKDTDTITIWHWITDRDDAFQELAKQYEEETGIKVKFDLYAPSNVYSRKIITAAQASVLPDIFGILDKKKIFASFIKSGFVADLTDEFTEDDEKWKGSIFPKALSVNVFKEGNIYGIKPGIYGVPIDVTNIQMLYNKKLLEKAGISALPKTFDEFIDVADTLKRIGLPNLVSGWGEMWMVDCFASNYAFNIMGEEKIMATFKGEVPYTDADWIKVFGIFEQLREHNAFIAGIVTKPNKEAEQDFALERATFAFNGSWCVNVYHEMNPDLEYGAMIPPAINSRYPMRIWGGAGSSFVVNDRSERKERAIEFLRWVTAKEQQAFLSKETKNLPSNRKALSAIPEILSDFAKSMDYTTHPTIWPYNEDPLVLEAFDRGIQSIIIGEKTPQQVAGEVQKVKERQLSKAKKRQ